MAKATKRADGRLVKTIVDSRTRKRIYFYGSSMREINQKIVEYSEKRRTGRPFSLVADKWWEEAEPNLARQSVKTYRPALKRAKEKFGDTPMQSIMPRDIESLLKKMASSGYAKKTISNQKLVISLVFNYAVIENDIQINPCSSVSVPLQTKKATRTAASEKDENIIKSLEGKWIFPYIALMSGLRKGEILALQWKDIDFENNVISVTKSVGHEGDQPYIKEPKTEAGNRIVPLLAPLKAELLKISPRIPDKFIVSDTGDKPLTNRRYITLYDEFKRETGITCTAHQLRHSFATIAFESGLDAKTVQEIIGHKQISTTLDMYTDFRKKAFNAAADKLNSAMKE